jgi:Fe2+ transport system protein FeoA
MTNTAKIGGAGTLDQLTVGDSAIVIDVRESAEVREHLAARGIGPGTVVRVLKAGDPLVVAVEEARWAIGQRYARAVFVIAGVPQP